MQPSVTLPSTVVSSPEHSLPCSQALKTKPQKDLLTPAFITETATFNKWPLVWWSQKNSTKFSLYKATAAAQKEFRNRFINSSQFSFQPGQQLMGKREREAFSTWDSWISHTNVCNGNVISNFYTQSQIQQYWRYSMWQVKGFQEENTLVFFVCLVDLAWYSSVCSSEKLRIYGTVPCILLGQNSFLMWI